MKPRHSNIVYPEVRLRDVFFFMWKGVHGKTVSMPLTFLAIIAASVINIIIPLYYKKFFDVVSSSAERTALAPELVHIILVILALSGCQWVGWRVGATANVYFQGKTMAKLRQQAYDILSHHSYRFFTDNFAGSLVQRVGRYARAFEKLADRITWNFVPLLVYFIGVIVVTWTLLPRLSMLIFLWAVFYIVVNFFFSRWQLKYNIKAAAADSHTTAVLADAITNQNNIDIFSRHADESRRFREVTMEQAKITIFNWNIAQVLEAIQAALIIIIEFAVFYFAIQYWESGAMTIGIFVLLQVYIVGLGNRLWEVGRIIRDMYQGYADAKEMVEIMMLPYEIKDVLGAVPLRVPFGEVMLDDVTFAFNKTREVIQNVTMTIKPSEKVALVGPSGAGKTTFVRLLLRFYDVTGGKITIDMQNIRHATLDSLRTNVSLVPQDPLLFHRTIMENIRYGKSEATDAEVIEAARLAHCAEFIESLPHGYDTYVGERGIKLSGGERQRVAIARAILKNAPILVLDEATSSLDSHSESLIQDALDVLMKGKTVIVIAHRLSTVRKMDRIIVLKDGAVLEEGTHAGLIKKKKSLYAKLWDLQAGGFLRDEEEI